MIETILLIVQGVIAPDIEFTPSLDTIVHLTLLLLVLDQTVWLYSSRSYDLGGQVPTAKFSNPPTVTTIPSPSSEAPSASYLRVEEPTTSPPLPGNPSTHSVNTAHSQPPPPYTRSQNFSAGAPSHSNATNTAERQKAAKASRRNPSHCGDRPLLLVRWA